MLVRLSSHGQLVIPKPIRKSLGLEPGTQVELQLVGCKIVIEPVERKSPIDALYGRYAGADFLSDLEADHLTELTDGRTLRP